MKFDSSVGILLEVSGITGFEGLIGSCEIIPLGSVETVRIELFVPLLHMPSPAMAIQRQKRLEGFGEIQPSERTHLILREKIWELLSLPRRMRNGPLELNIEFAIILPFLSL
jgi:hypothetical protein